MDYCYNSLFLLSIKIRTVSTRIEILFDMIKHHSNIEISFYISQI